MTKYNKEGAVEQIKEALDSGQQSITDEGGSRRFIYARCPYDGFDSPVWRQDCSGRASKRLLFRCLICGAVFESPVEALFLR